MKSVIAQLKEGQPNAPQFVRRKPRHDEGVVACGYDLFGNRACKKVGNGDWRWYFYDGLKVVAEGTGSGNKIHYTNLPGAIGGIICRDATGANGDKLWFHYDRLGNVVAVSNEYGMVEAYSMDAFGNVVQTATGTNGYDETYGPSQPYHLTTKELDPDTGLYYFNARWYDAATGRFVSRDPLGGVSVYPLSGNSPANAADPSGLLEVVVAGATAVEERIIKETVSRACSMVNKGKVQNALDVPLEWLFGPDPTIAANRIDGPLDTEHRKEAVGCVFNCIKGCCDNTITINTAHGRSYTRIKDVGKCTFTVGTADIRSDSNPRPQGRAFGHLVNVIEHELGHSCGLKTDEACNWLETVDDPGIRVWQAYE